MSEPQNSQPRPYCSANCTELPSAPGFIKYQFIAKNRPKSRAETYLSIPVGYSGYLLGPGEDSQGSTGPSTPGNSYAQEGLQGLSALNNPSGLRKIMRPPVKIIPTICESPGGRVKIYWQLIEDCDG